LLKAKQPNEIRQLQHKVIFWDIQVYTDLPIKQTSIYYNIQKFNHLYFKQNKKQNQQIITYKGIPQNATNLY